MITRRTKVQLVIFVIITLVGVSYVGARYARLDRLVRDDAYTVVAHFAESGGIFTRAEVTYRGVTVGQVEKLVLTDGGVDVHLGIQNSWDDIPADSLAVVGNKSAIGEQFVEIQPQVDPGETDDYLVDDSEIDRDDTETPLPTETLLGDLATTVGSVDREALRTTITELGDAFAGSGEDLQRIIDTGNSFIQEADRNFDVTTALIRDGKTVLEGQVASESALREFASGLSRFSTALAGADGDLRQVIDTGSFTATQLRTFIEDNQVQLGELIRNLTTTGEVIVKRLPGIEQLLVIYPYVVEGSFTVLSKTPATGLYDAHFGLIITSTTPCKRGYLPVSERRDPNDRGDIPFPTNLGCDEPITQSNPRGAQNAPPRAPVDYDRSPVVATYDPTTGELEWTEDGADRVAAAAGRGDGRSSGQGASGTTGPPASTATGSVAPPELGEETWKWLYLQPLLGR
ncbi:MlaD family protein [Nocardioides nanhaiensis]|uniref:MlaD family protein n=1 Tax=Nocardioides nanhaiensis TaxID=1476871 RepID=A0ABP8W8W6_9ACTN